MQCRECPNRNSFCYVCGLFTPSKHSRNFTKTAVKGFELYFLRPFQPNLWYTPQIICEYCYRCLNKIASKADTTTHRIRYVLPATWFNVFEHEIEFCYFCKTNTNGFRYETRENVKYADVECVIPPRKRSAENPRAPSEFQRECDENNFRVPFISDEFDFLNQPTTSAGAISSSFVPTGITNNQPHLITQAEFDDLVRDSKISQRSAEIWASRLSQWNSVASDFKITS